MNPTAGVRVNVFHVKDPQINVHFAMDPHLNIVCARDQSFLLKFENNRCIKGLSGWTDIDGTTRLEGHSNQEDNGS